MISRRAAIALAGTGLSALVLSGGSASALDYPTRPVRFVVGSPAGGATDIIARLIGQKLSERMGQQFVIENKPGAGNNIGTEAVVNANCRTFTRYCWMKSRLKLHRQRINLRQPPALENFVRDIAPVAIASIACRTS